MTMKTEWWYDDATYHYSGNSELVLARFITQDDGTAQLLIGGQELREFENEDEASCWLVDEEYEPLSSLIEDFAERGVPVDPRIKVPTATSPEDLMRQMVIILDPGKKLVSKTAPNTVPTPAERDSSSSRSTPD
jgi:hypothetical protein